MKRNLCQGFWCVSKGLQEWGTGDGLCYKTLPEGAMGLKAPGVWSY